MAVSFTQATIKRAIAAAEAAGKPVTAIHFPPAGGFTLMFGDLANLADAAALAAERNEWDVVLGM